MRQYVFEYRNQRVKACRMQGSNNEAAKTISRGNKDFLQPTPPAVTYVTAGTVRLQTYDG